MADNDSHELHEQKGTQNTNVEWLQKELDRKKAAEAKYRTERNELREKLETLQPLADKAKTLEEAQMSEIEKMTAALQAANKALETEQAEKARLQREYQLKLLARDAGVDDDTLNFLNTEKIDVNDPEAATAVLKRFAPQAAQPAKNVVNPPKQKGALTKDEFSALTLDERVKLMTENPGIIAQLTE